MGWSLGLVSETFECRNYLYFKTQVAPVAKNVTFGSPSGNRTHDPRNPGLKNSKYIKLYKTRNSDPYNYKIKFAKQDYLKNFYFIRVTTLWNKLLKDGKLSLSLTFLKNSLHNFYTKEPGNRVCSSRWNTEIF